MWFQTLWPWGIVQLQTVRQQKKVLVSTDIHIPPKLNENAHVYVYVCDKTLCTL
jgi:hypothetical protein